MCPCPALTVAVPALLQVLCSLDVRQNVTECVDPLGEVIEASSLGMYTLKGVSKIMELFQYK
jgi:hypothetical protein